MKSITALTGMSDERALTLKFRSSVNNTTSLNIFLGSPKKVKNEFQTKLFLYFYICIFENLPSTGGLSMDS